jgi:hypothetical protein
MAQQPMSESQWVEYLRNDTANGINRSDDYGVTIADKIFTENFNHQGAVGITLKNCVFSEKMTLLSCAHNSTIYLIECVFKKEVYLGDITSEQKIVFLNCSIEGQAVFGKIEMPRLDLNLRYAYELIFSDECCIDHIQIGGKDRNIFRKLSLYAGVGKKRIEINHTEIEELYISNSTLDCELEIVNSYLKHFTLDKFRNNGALKFLNCRASRTGATGILINQSNLAKAEFVRFDFSSFDKINITNSVIYESVFINCSWSKENMVSEVVHFSPELNSADEIAKQALAQNRRDVFKQIKTAFAKQGDYVQEQFFHGLEMNQYYRSLSYRNDFWTKVILRLSYFTSNYGQSLIRPVIGIIVVNLLLFWMMFSLHSTDYNSSDFTKPGNYVNTIASVLNFMNPLHKTDKLSGMPFIVDSVSRVFSSYMIYNIIRSTRRFVK